MKAIRIIFSTLLISSLSFSALAHNAENRDAEGKIIRGPYLTNGIWDNWFVNIGGGINFFGDGGYTPAMGYGLDINVGKWFNPEWGARAGYSGLFGAMWGEESHILGGGYYEETGKYKHKFGFAYFHADLMLDFTNAVWGLKEDRVWSVIPYVHAGLFRTYDHPLVVGAYDYLDHEIAGGLGLLNNFRLTKRLDLTLDVRGILLSGRHHGEAGGISGAIEANVGIAVNLGKTTWERTSQYHNPADTDKISAAEASIAALTAANAALAAEKANLENRKAGLKAENGQLASALETAENNAGLKEVGPASFYFEIGQTELSKKELKHLDFYMQNVLPYVKNGKATVVTGTADSNTGYAKRNEYLSKKRAEYMINLLQTKYGIDTANIVVKNSVIKAARGAAAFDRAVVVSFE